MSSVAAALNHNRQLAQQLNTVCDEVETAFNEEQLDMPNYSLRDISLSIGLPALLVLALGFGLGWYIKPDYVDPCYQALADTEDAQWISVMEAANRKNSTFAVKALKLQLRGYKLAAGLEHLKTYPVIPSTPTADLKPKLTPASAPNEESM